MVLVFSCIFNICGCDSGRKQLDLGRDRKPGQKLNEEGQVCKNEPFQTVQMYFPSLCLSRVQKVFRT